MPLEVYSCTVSRSPSVGANNATSVGSTLANCIQLTKLTLYLIILICITDTYDQNLPIHLAVFHNGVTTREICQEDGLGVAGEIGPRIQHLFCALLSPQDPANICFSTSKWIVFLNCEETTSHNILFHLQVTIFEMRTLATLVSYSVLLGLSHVYVLLSFCVIFLL